MTETEFIETWNMLGAVGHHGAMAELAANPHCPPILLSLAVHNPLDVIRAGAARNPILIPVQVAALLSNPHPSVCAGLAGNPSTSAGALVRILASAPSDDVRIAAMRNPRADEATILAAIAAGPLTDAICDAVLWSVQKITAPIASAILAHAHVGITRRALIPFAHVAGAKRLAEALNTVECLVVARSRLVAAMGDGIPPFELQQALDAIKIADAALDHLLYDRRRGPPAPINVW